MSINLRPFDFSDADYEKIFAILVDCFPESRRTLDGLKHLDQSTPDDVHWMRSVAELDGEPVGFGTFVQAFDMEEPNQYYVSFLTAPGYRNRGIASAYMDRLKNDYLAGRPVGGLLVTTTNDQPEAVSFLENRGFKSQLKVVETKIELDMVDFKEYDQIMDHISNAGIKIRSLGKLIPIDPDYKTKLYDLEWVLRQDEPHAEEPKRSSFEVFNEEYFNQPSFDPENWIIALHRNDYVGWSILYPHPSSEVGMHTSLTVVDRPYRRKGVGRAIKYASFKRAKTLGKEWMTTSNEESNPMLKLNLSLGYKPQRTRLEYKLESL